MLLIPISNPNLKPWDIFNNHESPDLSISGNTIIDGKEWFNAYMPPLPKALDISNTKWMFEYLRKFFETEEKLLLFKPPVRSLEYYLAVLYLSVNLTQTYLDPVEVVATRKRWPKKYNSLNKLEKITSEQIDALTRYFTLETTIFPLVILSDQKQNNSYKTVLTKAAKLLMCSDRDLTMALARIETIFHPAKLMDKTTASKIINSNAKRIRVPIKPIDQYNYDLQIASTIITWSKYINKRFSATNHTLKSLLNFKEIANDKHLAKRLKPQTTSGAEQYGIAIYTLVYLFNQSPRLKASVIKKTNKMIQS